MEMASTSMGTEEHWRTLFIRKTDAYILIQMKPGILLSTKVSLNQSNLQCTVRYKKVFDPNFALVILFNVRLMFEIALSKFVLNLTIYFELLLLQQQCLTKLTRRGRCKESQSLFCL